MKIWSSSHVFEHSWDTVAQAVWRKYPNPHKPEVHATDIIERVVQDGVLHSNRLISSHFGLPAWSKKLLGADDVCYGFEVSQVDPVNKTMVLRTRNLTYDRTVTMLEKMTYMPAPPDPSQPGVERTLLLQESSVEVHGIPFSGYLEDTILGNISRNSQKGRVALQYTIDTICHKDVHQLTEEDNNNNNNINNNNINSRSIISNNNINDITNNIMSENNMAISTGAALNDGSPAPPPSASLNTLGTAEGWGWWSLLQSVLSFGGLTQAVVGRVGGEALKSVDELADLAMKSVDETLQAVDEISGKALKSVDEFSGKALKSVDEFSGQALKSVDEFSGKAMKSVDEMSEKALKSVDEMSEKALKSVDEISEKALKSVDEISEKAKVYSAYWHERAFDDLFNVCL